MTKPGERESEETRGGESDVPPAATWVRTKVATILVPRLFSQGTRMGLYILNLVPRDFS